MEKNSFWQKIFFTYILIQAGITLAMGVIGTLFTTDLYVPYEAFFLPFLFALLCLIPDFIFYSTKEPSIRRIFVEKIVRFFMLEGIVLGTQKFLSPSTPVTLMVAIGVSVAVIMLFIEIVHWLYDSREAENMNRKLREYHRKE